MAQKIALQELQRRIDAGEIGELEVRRYFRTNEDFSPKPFFPGLELDADTVEIPAGGLGPSRVKFGLLIKAIIAEQRAAREMEYRYHVRQGYKPIIVARGDSWFLHPALSDVIDWLRGGYAIRSFDYPGDTLDDIVGDKNTWEGAVQGEGASIVLLSGGGNDAIGGGAIASHLLPFDSTITNPAEYVKDSYHALINTCLGKIEALLKEVLALSHSVSVVCHGYDYVIPNGGKWLGQPMSHIGIKDRALQKRITDFLVDTYNTRLHAMLKPYSPRVYHLDLRGVVTTGWDDELHPSDAGFRQVASHFRGVIDRLRPAV